MEQLVMNQSFLDKNWLKEISPELNEISKILKVEDEKDQENIPKYANQIAIIFFDYLSRYYLRIKEIDSTDAKILLCRCGRDERGSYRLDDKLYAIDGKIFSFQEEYLNIAKPKAKDKDKETYRWFVDKLYFPEEGFKEEFVSILIRSGYVSSTKKSSSKMVFNIERARKDIRKEIFEDKSLDCLNKTVADYFSH